MMTVEVACVVRAVCGGPKKGVLDDPRSITDHTRMIDRLLFVRDSLITLTQDITDCLCVPKCMVLCGMPPIGLLRVRKCWGVISEKKCWVCRLSSRLAKVIELSEITNFVTILWIGKL
jgi:hypothetical protein